MNVSAAQCQAAIDQLKTGLGDLNVELNRIGPAARAAASQPLLPPWVADALTAVGQKLQEIGSWLLDKITELLKGAAAPGFFADKAYDWEDVRGAASGVAGDLAPEVLQAGRVWHGEAEQAYARQIPPQGAAATRIAAIADKTAVSLGICAAAGAAFYVALGVIVFKLISATVAAIAAFGSVVFSWAGLLIIVEEVGVDTGMVVAQVPQPAEVLRPTTAVWHANSRTVMIASCGLRTSTSPTPATSTSSPRWSSMTPASSATPGVERRSRKSAAGVPTAGSGPL
jgi:uncharacterized protein YukE